MGEALIDILPARRSQTLQQASLLRRVAGGATANVSVGLAKLGCRAAFLGKVGADPLGYFLQETLSSAGVDVSHMLFESAANTGLAFAWVDDIDTGEARYLFYRGNSAHYCLSAEDLDKAWLASASILQYGSLLLAREPSASATRLAIKIARSAGLLCVYDLNLRLPAWQDAGAARAGMKSLLELSDVVKLNRHELAFLTGETDLERGVKSIWREENQLLIVTLDREGCFFRSRKASGYIPGYPVQVVDTVGCGDAFMAVLLARFLKERKSSSSVEGFAGFDFENADLIKDVCRYANAAGALTATRAGAIPALPGRLQLSRFLKTPFPVQL
ncbi:MAG TPA: carbohydrate kinase [Chloroflexia bacterium]|nr:carbohydrate kinase [Chloroflexia bacterium]